MDVDDAQRRFGAALAEYDKWIVQKGNCEPNSPKAKRVRDEYAAARDALDLAIKRRAMGPTSWWGRALWWVGPHVGHLVVGLALLILGALLGRSV